MSTYKLRQCHNKILTNVKSHFQQSSLNTQASCTHYYCYYRIHSLWCCQDLQCPSRINVNKQQCLNHHTDFYFSIRECFKLWRRASNQAQGLVMIWLCWTINKLAKNIETFTHVPQVLSLLHDEILKPNTVQVLTEDWKLPSWSWGPIPLQQKENVSGEVYRVNESREFRILGLSINAVIFIHLFIFGKNSLGLQSVIKYYT